MLLEETWCFLETNLDSELGHMCTHKSVKLKRLPMLEAQRDRVIISCFMSLSILNNKT